MTSYSKEQKAALIAKMLEPNPVSVPELAKETGIPKDTLSCWRNRAHKAAGVAPAENALLAKSANGKRHASRLSSTFGEVSGQ
jgi:transposase-like protein